MAQLEILAHHRTAQVKIAVLHTQLITAVGIVFDGEGWGSALADDIEFTDDNLDVARRQLRILGITLGNGADSLNDVFASQAACLLLESRRAVFVESQLRDAVTVT